VAKVKGPTKREGKWQERISQRVIAKKKSWLVRMHQIEILHIFVPNLREIYLFGNK